MRREIRQPLEYTTILARRYDDLITGKADTDIDELVERIPSFDELGQELRRYASTLNDINYNTVKMIRLGTFEVLTTHHVNTQYDRLTVMGKSQIKSRCQPNNNDSILYSLCAKCHQCTSGLTVNVSAKITDGTITEINSLTQLQ